uniref:NOF_1 protein n=2 Tax=Fopius arisanus TaxID=64838 RepID=A0A0C9PYU4_9HYME
MPRAPAVTHDEAVALVEKFIDHFKTSNGPPFSSPIWKEMSKAVGGRWQATNIYNTLRQNRNNIVTEARANKGVSVKETPVADIANHTIDSTFDESLPLDEDNDDPYEFELKAKGLDVFNLYFSHAVWQEMLGTPILYNDGRVYSILAREKWAGLLSLIIFDQTQLPCAYVFENAKIYNSPDSLHYCRITGHCRSKACGNPLFCYIEKPPGDADKIHMILRTNETYYNEHENVKRELRGWLRQHVGENVYFMGAGNWQKEEAVRVAPFGGRVGPNIPNMNVLRKGKNEFINRKYDIKPGEGKDMVKTVEQMRYSEPYNSFIHEVRRDKFYVSYSTYGQMLAYKKYCKLMGDDAAVGIDGTGSLIKKFRRLDGTKVGHIFLYSITINHGGRTIAVHEALTEGQDADTFTYWLRRWVKLGAPTPPQASCDRSRALMNAVCSAFNDMPITVYVEIMFLRALNHHDDVYYPPIYSFLRNDVAHLMILVAKQETFKKIPFATVRHMYLYCLALLIDAQNLQQFREIFLLTLTIGLHKSDDTVIKAIPGGTVAQCREQLENYIATRKFAFDVEELTEYAMKASNTEKDDSGEFRNSGKSPIADWINDLRNTVEYPKEKCNKESGKLNVCYAKEYIDYLVDLAMEFPVWSAAAIPRNVGHSTTAFTEGFFNDLKHRVNKNHPGSSRVNLFLKRMFVNNSAGVTLFVDENRNTASKKPPDPPGAPSHSPRARSTSPTSRNIKNLSNPREHDFSDSDSSDDGCNEADQKYPSKSSDNEINPTPSIANHSSLNSSREESNYLSRVPTHQPSQGKHQNSNCEDERNERLAKQPRIDKEHQSQTQIHPDDDGKVSRKRKGKYFKPRPDIAHRNELATNILKSSLLINGNRRPGKVSIRGKIHYSANTCGFDAIVQPLASAMMDDPRFKALATESSNKTLQFVLGFINSGSKAHIYQERTKLLQILFPESIHAEQGTCSLFSSYRVDMFTHLVKIWTECFQQEPSLVCSNSCPRCGIYETYKATLSVEHDYVLNHKVCKLQEALQSNFKPATVTCSRTRDKRSCQETVTSKPKAVRNLIFIELDIPIMESGVTLNCYLNDFPKYLQLLDGEFRLAGIIVTSSGHHTSYCWRVNKTWEWCNDLGKSIEPAVPKTQITPSAAIYVKIRAPGNNGNSGQDGMATDAHAPSYETMSGSILSRTPPPIPNTHLSNGCALDSPCVLTLQESALVHDNLFLSPTNMETKPAQDFRRKVRDPDTFSHDNWRNMGDPEGFWIDATDESSLVNDFTGETFHGDMTNATNPILHAGHMMPAVEMNGCYVHLKNTTAVDSIIHIIFRTATDDTNYMALIRQSTSKLLGFIGSLVNRDFDKNVYAERGVLLIDLFPDRVTETSENDDIICSLDLDDSVKNLWEILFATDPSAYKLFNCKKCNEYAVPVPIINVDSHLIIRNNITVLQEALQFYPNLRKVPCYNEKCKCLCSVECHANAHIYIDLELKISGRTQKPVKCKLRDIPGHLMLEMSYR